MQRNAFLLSAVMTFGVLIGFSGCKNSQSVRKVSSDKDRPLSNRQVAEVKLSLAHTLELQGEFEPALEAYRQAVEKDPSRSTGYWRMAIINDRQGNIGESEGLYRKALKLDPKNPEIHCDYGYSLYLQRRWGDAEVSLYKALDFKPKHSRSHNNLGLVMAQSERSEEALAEFRKAGCDPADAYNNLAFVMTLNRRFHEAREFYELALEANRDSATAKDGLEKLNLIVAKLECSPTQRSVSLATYERQSDENPTNDQAATVVPVSNEGSGRSRIATTNDD